MTKFVWVVISLLSIVLKYDSSHFVAQRTNLESSSTAFPQATHSRTHLGPDNVAIIVNDSDALSVEISNYYQVRRNIPKQNIYHVTFKPDQAVMTSKEFNTIKKALDLTVSQNIQAYALTWHMPYRVDCMSITTAFAMGYAKKFCADTCAPTALSPYFNSNSRAPYTDFAIRPTMSIAANTLQAAKSLIDRGIAADSTYPLGTGYLLDTNDKARNVRASGYKNVTKYLGGVVNLEIVNGDYINNKNDILFYFTGIAKVADLASNHFLPGAIGDHLTSAGGIFSPNEQMSSIKWLEAGATGSYGAVVEPCNYVDKFPQPGVVIDKYSSGDTLIEAYWKSVKMPGQGIFIGELLARPYGF